MAELTLINLLPVITTLLECHLKTFSISANWGHSVYIYSLICYIFIDTNYLNLFFAIDWCKSLRLFLMFHKIVSSRTNHSVNCGLLNCW